jgi:hypothetical protein
MHVERTRTGVGNLFLTQTGNLMVGNPELALALPYDFPAIDVSAAWILAS